jgi:hypothetical protein
MMGAPGLVLAALLLLSVNPRARWWWTAANQPAFHDHGA